TESNSVCPAGWKDLFVVFAGTEWDSTSQSNRCQARYSATKIRKQLSKWGTLWLDGWRTNLLLQRKNLSAKYSRGRFSALQNSFRDRRGARTAIIYGLTRSR